jgi:hypothetical protein
MRPALAPPDLMAVEESVAPRQTAARGPATASTQASRPALGAAVAAPPETVPTRQKGARLAPRGEVPAIPRNEVDRMAPLAKVPQQLAPMPVLLPAGPAAAGASLAAQPRAGQRALRELAAAAEHAGLARTDVPLAAGPHAVPAVTRPGGGTVAVEQIIRPATLASASRITASEPSCSPQAPAEPPIVTAPAPPSTSVPVASPPVRLTPPLTAPPPWPQPASERAAVHIGVLEVRVIPPPSLPVANRIAAAPPLRATAPTGTRVSRPIMMYGLAQS